MAPTNKQGSGWQQACNQTEIARCTTQFSQVSCSQTRMLPLLLLLLLLLMLLLLLLLLQLLLKTVDQVRHTC